MIKEFKIINYKSFYQINVPLGKFNVIVGSNGVGKSNFFDSLKFIQASLFRGITYATRKRSGWVGIKCRKTHKKYIEFGISGDFSEDFLKFGLKRDSEIKAKEYNYFFRFFEKERFRYALSSEGGEVKGVSVNKKTQAEEEITSKFMRMQKEKEQKVIVEEPFVKDKPQETVIPKHVEEKLFLGSFMSLASIALSEYIERWRFFKIDPESIRNPIVEETSDYVSERGETLPIILNRLEESEGQAVKDIRERILTLMSTLVPGFDKWQTEVLSDGRISFKIKEKKMIGAFTPFQISDGTLHLLGLLVAILYYQEKPTLICIEEPERNIHPVILEELVNLMRDVSQQVQVIVTTHSPYLVRFCKPEEVILADKIAGVTEMIRVDSIDKINEFLENFTIDELWLQRYLERGTP